jgi:hypothetical protein
MLQFRDGVGVMCFPPTVKRRHPPGRPEEAVRTRWQRRKSAGSTQKSWRRARQVREQSRLLCAEARRNLRCVAADGCYFWPYKAWGRAMGGFSRAASKGAAEWSRLDGEPADLNQSAGSDGSPYLATI